LCANEAEIVSAQDQAEYDQVEWEALVETTEVWVESLADQPRQSMVPSADNHSPLSPTYIGIDGTFIKAQPANRFWKPKRQLSSPTTE